MDRPPDEDVRAARHPAARANVQARAITVLMTATVTCRSRRR